jgi:hypothetical protein
MRQLLALLTALVFALASCGGDDDDDNGGGASGGGDNGAAVSDEDQITEVIETFADNNAEEACDVLTDEYVKQLFGDRDRCLEEGEGESTDVDEIDNIQINGDTAKADATADGETATFTFEKVGEGWKISGIEGPQ